MASARIRTIKPDFYVDERIADLSYPAAFHFPGLWLLADRAGRLLDRPREIKAKIAPLRNVQMEAILTELADALLIQRYEVDGVRYIQVVNFARHQHVNTHEPAAIFPAPIEPVGLARASTCKHVHARLEGNGMEWNGREGKGTSPSDVAVDPTYGFEQFWAVFRKKTHRQEALEAWTKLKPDVALRERIVEAVTWQFRQPQWIEDGCHYAPNGATYLNKQRWTDEPPPASTNGLGEKEARNLAAAARFVQAGKGT